MSLRRVVLAGLPWIVGCTRQPPSPPGPTVVTITATDYAFAAPDTIPAGITTLRLINDGREPHQAGLIEVDSGRTTAEALAAIMKLGPPPQWTVFVGGPDVVLPGDTATATQALEPGRYVLVCFVPSPDGRLHLQKGMFRPVVVKRGSTPQAPFEPPADMTVTLNDYAFALDGRLTAGTRALRVENSGPQVHELLILSLRPGKSVADVVGWDQTGMKGPPPGRPLGGIVALAPGRRATFTVTLMPGRYVLACFVPDVLDGRTHAMHGMVKEITVS
ncbi:MAG TPA: hypothetical protein VM736_08385 [Gemmatimonadales bacterium]|nr:hypothetical protein [Gemmatimonadales bacterium]